MAQERQSKADVSGSDPASITLDSTPVEGNLLVAIMSERSGGDATNHALTGITGWTETIQQTIESGSGTYRRTHSMYWKVAGASESTTVTFDDGTSNNKYLSVIEFEHVGGDEDQWVLLDSSSNDNGQTPNATTIGTGSTASQSGEMFLVASAVIKRGNTPESTKPTSWDTGLTLDQDFDPDNNNTMAHSIGSDAKDTVTGTKSSTCTLTLDGNNLGLSAAILVFDVESGAAAFDFPLIEAQRSYRMSGRFV